MMRVLVILMGVLQDASADGAGGVDSQDEPKAGQAEQVRRPGWLRVKLRTRCLKLGVKSVLSKAIEILFVYKQTFLPGV